MKGGSALISPTLVTTDTHTHWSIHNKPPIHSKHLLFQTSYPTLSSTRSIAIFFDPARVINKGEGKGCLIPHKRVRGTGLRPFALDYYRIESKKNLLQKIN